MINSLWDVSIRTPLALVPDIITYNNSQINAEFEYFYDSSNNRLTKSVYAPNGIVTAHLGNFVNLSCEYLTIKNTESLKGAIEDSMSYIRHNSLNGRMTSAIQNDETIQSYAHDANSIVIIDNNSLPQQLGTYINALAQKINTTGTVHSEPNSNIPNEMNYGAAVSPSYSASYIMPAEYIEPLVYDNNLLNGTFTQLRKLKYPLYHINDLTDGIRCAYYQVNGNEIKVNDKYIISLESKEAGQILNVKFDDTKTSGFYEIILNRETGLSVKLSKNPLNRIQLQCISYSQKYGTVWDIYQYSVTSHQDIMLKTKTN